MAKRKRGSQVIPDDKTASHSLPPTKVQKRTGPHSEARRIKSEADIDDKEDSDANMNTAASSDERLILSIIADEILPELRGMSTTRPKAENITREMREEIRDLCFEIVWKSEEQWIPDLDVALQLAAINPSAKERKDIMAPFMKNLQKEPRMRRFVVRHVIDEEEWSTLETRATEVNMMIAIHKETGRIPQERNDFLGKSAEHNLRGACWCAPARALNGTADKIARLVKLWEEMRWSIMNLL
ncbi:hypothetical protein CKAH01_01767 [Colletotrichum kahawae]|uniref:Uncharacterized protein n=1 Tax=Colletotrichum kahawae TaxID=34407 RepID=A0AAD9Y5W1_COLKA|nr:hypothetical protein CKAH01_01767 [Colletotrichum kahawae]